MYETKNKKKQFPCIFWTVFLEFGNSKNNQTLIYHEMLDLITMKRKHKILPTTRSNFTTQINGKDMVSSCN